MLGNAQLAEQKRSKLPVRKRSGKFTSQWIRTDCIAHSQDLLLDSQADEEHPPYARTLKDLASHLWGSSRRHPVETGLLCHENLCWTPRESVPQGDCLVRVQVLQRFGGNFPEGAKCCALADNELNSLLSEGKARMAVGTPHSYGASQSSSRKSTDAFVNMHYRSQIRAQSTRIRKQKRSAWAQPKQI
jgi:hypothetical protein